MQLLNFTYNKKSLVYLAIEIQLEDLKLFIALN
jgi:hypothetical protein